MNVYTSLIIVGSLAVGISTFLPSQIPGIYTSFISAFLSTLLSLLAAFLITKQSVEEEYNEKMRELKENYENKIRGLKREYDTTTLEKTIRDGTQTLIKNALDYFKLENIKNEMGNSAAISNLQLDKYGQIIELLAEFSLILPDFKENREIVQREIDHQITIYLIDEKPFATFLQRIMEKYLVTVNKKMREKIEQTGDGGVKTCPRCAEHVLIQANVCKYCSYDFKVIPQTPDHSAIALDRLEKGKKLYRLAKYNEAIDILSSAIELKPDFAAAYYNRAIIYYKIGDDKKAESDLKEASYLGYKKAKKLLEKIE
ncbi:tetratricopeptide repeat protein [Desulfococcaceae bacterium HSG8]|nr:tetratricopeptide repeat protein [Desulfococcaceae bacterium HSG8]